MRKYVKSVAEVAAYLPRRDGRLGLAPRQAQDWLQAHGIKKTANGWPLSAILEQAKEQTRKQAAPVGLDAEIKRRKIRLLDIEIATLENNLIDRAEYRRRVMAMQTICLGLIDMWIQNISAKRADAALMADLEQCRDAAKTELVAIREIEPSKNDKGET
jgi:hypothetical protein